MTLRDNSQFQVLKVIGSYTYFYPVPLQIDLIRDGRHTRNNRGLSRAPMINGCSSSLFDFQPACVSPSYKSSVDTDKYLAK